MMNRFSLCVLWTVLGCAALGAPRSATGEERVKAKKENGTPIDNDKKWIARKDGTDESILRILVPESSTSTDLFFDVVIQQRGQEKLRFGENGYLLDCVLKLTTKEGVPVPYSPTGRLFSGRRDLGDRGQYAIITLAPKESRSWEFNLAYAFEPLKEGEYRLTLEAKAALNSAEAEDKFEEQVTFVVKDIPIIVTSDGSVRK